MPTVTGSQKLASTPMVPPGRTRSMAWSRELWVPAASSTMS